MKFQRTQREPVEVNLAPLIDVVFLLLIFFMVTTTFTKETRLTLDLPEAEGEASTDIPNMLEVTVSADAQYAVNGQALVDGEADTLKIVLLELSGGDVNRPLVVTSDAAAPYQAVVTVMDVAGQLGFVHLNITTQRPAEAE